jgi:xylulokinase
MIMLPHDYLNWCLTGRFTVEAGDSSGTGWFDTRSKSFSQKILEWVQFEHPIVQPDILESHEVVANLHPKMAKQLGLRPDVLVSSGGGDNMMAAIGTGNVGTGQLTISLGTSGTLFSHSLVQVDSEEHPDLNVFCSSTNGYLPLSSTMNVTTANNQILDLLNTDISQFDALLNASQLGANGLVCLPFFNGARLPNVPKANGAILGITASNMTRSNMLRATVEGVTYNLRKGAEVLMQAGVKFENACIIGGGANSPVWKQIISDTLNLPLWTPKSTEAAAFGAATQACWARENQHQHISISDLCADTISIDERLSVEPNKDRYQRYESEFNRYQLEVERHMAQFV